MKKLIITTLTAIAVAVACYVILPYMHDTQTDALKEQIRIALFTPTTHPALEEIEQGFKETLQTLSHELYAFTTFNANGNRTLLRAQAEEIVTGKYDLIFTIGATCSQTVAELLKKKDLDTPHVFGGVDGHELAQSLEALNNSTTGVYVQVDYKKAMDVSIHLNQMQKTYCWSMIQRMVLV